MMAAGGVAMVLSWYARPWLNLATDQQFVWVRRFMGAGVLIILAAVYLSLKPGHWGLVTLLLGVAFSLVAAVLLLAQWFSTAQERK
jgi:uncharacterized membrane protein